MTGEQERQTYICRRCGRMTPDWNDEVCSCLNDTGERQVVAFVEASAVEGLTKPGDQMQSACSRLAEWVRDQDAPYEVAMAALEGLSAVEEWTLARAYQGEGKR